MFDQEDLNHEIFKLLAKREYPPFARLLDQSDLCKINIAKLQSNIEDASCVERENLETQLATWEGRKDCLQDTIVYDFIHASSGTPRSARPGACSGNKPTST